ncbi:MAG: hypothetical protein ABR498_01830 [Candidatus Dormibacteria bacterium]
MADESEEHKEAGEAKHGTGDRVRDRLRAAEVAAEGAAGYGWATEAVEATEAAIDPERELRSDEGDEQASEPSERPASNDESPAR